MRVVRRGRVVENVTSAILEHVSHAGDRRQTKLHASRAPRMSANGCIPDAARLMVQVWSLIACS